MLTDFVPGYSSKTSQNIREFNNLEEVFEVLDTLTFEEAVTCNAQLGIVFEFGPDGIEGARYENKPETFKTLQDLRAEGILK